jgi:hypothetical protein
MAALRASVEAARKRKPSGEPTEAARKVRETATRLVEDANDGEDQGKRSRTPRSKPTASGARHTSSARKSADRKKPAKRRAAA